MADEILSVEARLKDHISANIDKLEKKLVNFGNTTKEATEKAASGTGKLTSSFTNMAASFATGQVAVNLAIKALKVLYNQTIGSIGTTAKYGNEIDKMSKRLELSTDFIQKFSYVAELSGTSMGQLEKGFRTIEGLAADAGRGVKLAEDSFLKLGISIYNTNGTLKSTTEIINESINALADVKGSTDRVALATDLFGESGTAILPILSDGKDGIKAMMEEAEKYGAVLSEKAIKTTVDFTNNMYRLKTSFNSFKMNALIPVINELANYIATLHDANGLVVREVSKIKSEVVDNEMSRLERESDRVGNLIGGIAGALATNDLTAEEKRAIDKKMKMLIAEQDKIDSAIKKRKGQLSGGGGPTGPSKEELDKKFDAEWEAMWQLDAFIQSDNARKLADIVKFETDKKMLLRAEKDLELAMLGEYAGYEKDLLAEAQKRELEDFEGNETQKSALLKKQELDRYNARENTRKKDIEREKYYHDKRVDLTFSTANSVTSATKTIISASGRETRSRQSMLAALTAAEGIAMSIRAASEAWKSVETGDFYSKAAISIATAASIGASVAGAVASIKSQNFNSYAMGTDSARGGRSLVGEQGMELVTGPRFGNLSPGSVVYNNTETKELLKGDTLVFNFSANTDRNTAREIENILLEAERDGRLETFKRVMAR